MKELEKLIMAVVSLLHAPTVLPPEKEPGTHWIGAWVGPRSGSERCGEEKHLALAGNPNPAVQPVARRDATNTGVIRMECTPPHIYFSLYLCVPALNNFTLLQSGCIM
jgi:hypothetical protein